VGITTPLTGITQRFVDETRKGFGFMGAFALWQSRLKGPLVFDGLITGPSDVEHETGPQEGDEQERIEQQVRDHDIALSHRGEMSRSYPILAF
jgi:hypothetical protein